MNSTHIRLLPLLLFSLAIIFSVSSPSRAADVTADFTDTNFRDCVCAALGTCPSIDDGDAATIIMLTCDNQNITSLAGIQHLTALTTLNIDNNSITDTGFAFISGVNTITSISMANNQVSDLSPIANPNLPNLAGLGIGNNNVSDLSPLSGKPLTLLHIWGNPITNISPLGNAPNPQTTMQDLRIAPITTTIADLSPIQGMTSLTHLDIYGMGITSLTGANGPFDATNTYNSLDYLDFQQNSISDISVITPGSFPALVELRAGDNQITDISFLSSITSLTAVYLSTNSLDSGDLASLSPLTALVTLDLEDNNITTLGNLAGLDNLTSLNLKHNALSSLSAVGSGNTNLPDFASGLSLDITYNIGLYSDSEIPAHLSEVATLTGAGATVTHDMEDCGNHSDDDGDGLVDPADPFCYDTTDFYVDYDTGSTAASCGTLANPCLDISELIGATIFGEVVSNAPYEDIQVYVQGTKTTGESISDQSSLYNDVAFTSLTFQPWQSTPILDGANLTVRSDNTTIDGFEIRGDTNNAGIDIQTTSNAVLRNNYIHGMGMGVLDVSNSNTQIYNNIFADNRGRINVGGPPPDACGGVVVSGSSDTTVINNTLFRNCDTFDIAGNVKYGDIAVVGIPAYALSDPTNTTVKQNLVYNTNGGANTFYYDVTNDDPAGQLINGAAAGAVMTNAAAAAHGSVDPHNSIAATDPFADISLIASYAEAIIGFAINPLELINYQFDANLIDAATPNLDIRGRNRPSGPSEPGALEYQTNAGGRTRTEKICAEESLTPLNLPETIKDVTYQNGDVSVTLNWDEVQVKDVNADRKIDILFEYLEDKNPGIGTHEKRLRQVFARHMFEMMEGEGASPELKTALKTALQDVLYSNPPAVTNLQKSIGIEKRYSDWWPYLLLNLVENDEEISSLLLKSAKIGAAYRNQHGDIRRSLLTGLQKEWERLLGQKRFRFVETVASCAADYVKDFSPDRWSQLAISADIMDIRNQKGGERLEAIIRELAEDTSLENELIGAAENSARFSDLLTKLGQNRHLRRLINYFQRDEDFLRLKNDVFSLSAVKNAERCVVDNYGELPQLFRDTQYELIHDFIQDDKACSTDTYNIVMPVIHRLRQNPEIKAEVDAHILSFIDDLLWVEGTLMNKTKEDSNTFLYAYAKGLQGAIGEIMAGAEIDVYRFNDVIDTLKKSDPAYEKREYTDSTLPSDTSGKVKYHLTVKTNCGEVDGSIGSATIAPKIEAGEKVSVTVDLALRVKEDIDKRFIERLNELTSERDDEAGSLSALPEEEYFSEDGISFDVLKDEETIALDEMGRIRQSERETSPCAAAETNLHITKANLVNNPRIDWSHAAFTLADLAYKKLVACESHPGIRRYLEKARDLTVFHLAATLRDNRDQTDEVIETVTREALEKAKARLAAEDASKSNLLALRDILPENLTFNRILQSEELKEQIKYMGDVNKSDASREQMRANFKSKEESHALDGITLRIHNLDDPEAPPKTFTVNTDIFGEATVLVGELISGTHYEMEVLAGDYFIPEFRSFVIERGQPSGGTYKVTIPFRSDGRYGNFKTNVTDFAQASVAEKKAEKIDRQDLIAWVKLAGQDPEAANIDAEPGLSLNDFGVFRENLGATAVEAISKEEIDVRKILEIILGLPEKKSSEASPLPAPVTSQEFRSLPWLKWVKDGCDSCLELEGGKALFSQNGVTTIYPNRCAGNTLVEYGCPRNDTLTRNEEACPYGCEMGQCKAAPEEACIVENKPVPLTAPGYERECCKNLVFELYEPKKSQYFIPGLKGFCRSSEAR